MPGVGRCRDCGEEIHWLRTPYGKTAPPMVPGKGTEYLVIDGILYSGTPWKRHICDPDRVAAREHSELVLEQRREESRRIKREADEARETRRLLFLKDAHIYEAARDAREAFGAEVYRLAMMHVCPDCEAVVGDPCLNLSFARAGKHQYTKNPHAGRIELIPGEHRPFWLSTTEFVAPARLIPREGDT